jgi:ADP-ribosylglycohydrolase
MITLRDRYRGCLLGGAVGDALGSGIEFASLAKIRQLHGPAGVTGYVLAYGRLGAITDDTQMSLFTAEGLLRAKSSADADPVAAVWRAYQRWLITQTGKQPVPGASADIAAPPDGWLIGHEFLHHRRGPGRTCMSALLAGVPGSISGRLNNSKGCGGAMRSAPAGLADRDAFRLGCDVAALTHSHPSGYLAAGALAAMINELGVGRRLPDTVDSAIGLLRDVDGSAETIAALQAAAAAASVGRASAEVAQTLGEGWVAEEALAIAMYCALVARDFRHGVLLAVNHGGDSDSTGAICGNLLGMLLGAGAIDDDLLDGLEGRAIITQVADDLHDVFALGRLPPAERYPAG